MYGKIFFLIILCDKVLSDDEEINEKYIDLLPEEEKQEFLNRIARRILERIKNDNIPNESHADITDDQLDAQDSFVKEILKDESENIKNEMKQTDQEVDGNQQVQLKAVESNDKIDSQALLNTGDLEEITESQQRLSDNIKSDKILHLQDNDDNIQNIDERTEFNNNNKEEHVDETLIEGKRQKRKDGANNIEAEITTEISYDVIPVKTIYGQDKDDVQVINEPENISVSKNIQLQAEHEGNSTNGKKKVSLSEAGNSYNLLLATSDLKISDSFNDTDRIVDLENLKDGEITVSSLGNSSNIEVSNNDLLLKSNKITNSENLRKSFYNKLESTGMKDFQPSDAHFNISHDHNKNEVTTLVPTVSPVITARREKVNVEEEQQKTTKVNYNSTNNEVLPTKLNEITVSVGNSETSEFYNSSPKTSSVTLENSKEVVKHKTKRDSALESHSGELNELKNDTKEQFNNKILRARLDDDLSQIDEYEPFQKAEESKNVKVYEVYEVDSAQPHFISTGEKKQNENPLYVPVYNYAPENAYFKPYNKFGPNVEDMKKQDIPEMLKEEYSFKILPNTRNRFSGYGYNKKERNYDKKTYEANLINNNKKAKSLADDFVKTLKEKLINHDIYFNAHDYADLDYYYGRILRRDERRRNEYNNKPQIHKEIENRDENNYEKFIPDSNDAETSIHKSDKMKNNLRAIRKILYLKNHFGYVPKENANVVRNANLYSETSDKPKKDSIAIDYYFGRADSDENPIDMSNVVHRLKNKSMNKETNTDFLPLTPNPLHFDIPKNLPIKTVIINRDSYSISQEISFVHFEELFEALLAVLKDSIQVKNEDLVKYNWLKTTVNIQAALRKLLDLIKQLKYGEYIHPKDLELIKYTIYIFKSSKTTLDQESKNRDLNKIKSLELQRAKKKNTFQKMPKTKRLTKIKEPIRLWKNFATFLRSDEVETEETKYKMLDEFEVLLRELLFNLHELHDAIKQIAIITEYKNQNWFKDLKDLYLGKGNNKNLAQVLLHLGLSKLLDSIEDSSAHGVEENFRSFVKKNREDVEKSKEECILVLKILEELKRIEP